MGILIAVLAFVFIIGLCIGSFLNVVILRTLSEESIVFPASKCPKCQSPLKWWHNIPVISYICLKGKCAFCKEPISIQYPLIELFTAIIFTLIFLKFGLSLQTLIMWIVASLLIVIAGTDIKEKVVYDVHTYSLIGIGLLYALTLTILAVIMMHKATYNLPHLTLLNNPLTISILGAFGGALIMEIFARAGYLVAGGRAFGEGDTLIAAGLGAVFGWQLLVITLILSVIVQVILFLPMFIKGLICNKDWKTLVSFLLFCAYALSFYLLQHLGYLNQTNIILYSIGAIILAILGILVCALIFKGLKENPQNKTYLPFGPAMVVAAFIVMILI